MTTQPQPERPDLASFLHSCIEDDERVARECPEHHWTSGPYVDLEYYAERGEAQLLGPRWLDDDGLPMLPNIEADHIARHDPARVLADCEAKRKIVETHVGAHECPTEDENCGWWHEDQTCYTLRLLAQPYADRPGYDETWGVE